MQSFRDMPISEQLLKSLEKLNIITPTEIQQKTIIPGLSGRDILACAQTGTGKTLAYLIPVIEKLRKNQDAHALILVPTRELAIQVLGVVKQIFNNNPEIFAALLIGGEPFGRQARDLESKKTRIIIGTPGRVIDHLERGTLDTNKIQMLVLDEMDRMFDIGFAPQINSILKELPKKIQKFLFSATITNQVAKIVDNLLYNPEKILMKEENRLDAVATISQEVVHIQGNEKYTVLVEQLGKTTEGGAVIIFVKTKFGAKKLAQKLITDKFPTFIMHGDLTQERRRKEIAGFRIPHKKGNLRIMVATNVAARGIDIQDINNVINYDLPQTVEEYVHRIGRTGRGGRSGNAVSLVSKEDRWIWKQIEKNVLKKPASAAPMHERHQRPATSAQRHERHQKPARTAEVN